MARFRLHKTKTTTLQPNKVGLTDETIFGKRYTQNVPFLQQCYKGTAVGPYFVPYFAQPFFNRECCCQIIA